MKIESIAQKTIQKKSLSGISIDVVKEEVRKYIIREKIDLDNVNEKDIKIIVHDVRAILRKLSGSYRDEAVDLCGSAAHASTRERKDYYPALNEKIAFLSPRSILDLGCGLNPLEVHVKGASYYALDIDQSAIEKVSSFFSEQGIDGFARVADIRAEKDFPKADLCLILKVLDVLDEKNHKNSESLLKKLSCKHIIISFSTKTLSGAPMRHPQRGWIEHLLSRLGFIFESFSSNNEIFYLAHRKV